MAAAPVAVRRFRRARPTMEAIDLVAYLGQSRAATVSWPDLAGRPRCLAVEPVEGEASRHVLRLRHPAHGRPRSGLRPFSTEPGERARPGARRIGSVRPQLRRAVTDRKDAATVAAAEALAAGARATCRPCASATGPSAGRFGWEYRDRSMPPFNDLSVTDLRRTDCLPCSLWSPSRKGARKEPKLTDEERTQAQALFTKNCSACSRQRGPRATVCRPRR